MNPRRRLPALLLAAALIPAGAAGATAVSTSSDTAVEASSTISASTQSENLEAILKEIESIQNENGGDRQTGSAGYDAVQNYVKGELEAAGYEVTIQEYNDSWRGPGKNMIAELPAEGGETNAADPIVMFGAHLDGVGGTHGINDNGTGVAATLQMAKDLAASDSKPTKRVQFAFWDAEEIGLVGSSNYVDQMPAEERDAMEVYVNTDMIGSHNAAYFVYNEDQNGTEYRDQLLGLYSENGIEAEPSSMGGRSDHAGFMNAGIPTAGVFSGAEGQMTQEQAQKWNGTAGEAYDACYHQACDDFDNLNTGAMGTHAKVLSDFMFALVTEGSEG